MYRLHDWAELHRLSQRKGWDKTDIADKLEMSRNRLTRLFELSEPPPGGVGGVARCLAAATAAVTELFDPLFPFAGTRIPVWPSPPGWARRTT